MDCVIYKRTNNYSLQCYLFISSSDSKSYYPENKPHTFIVELGERINLISRWLVALSDLNLNVTTTETLYIFCDIFDISYIKNSMKPILRMIYPTGSSKSFSFLKRYNPIVQRNFTHLQIYIRDKTMNVPAIITEDLELTLHLKKEYYSK